MDSFISIGSANANINSQNIFMYRMALKSIVFKGKPLLTRLELIMLQMLLTDGDSINDLEIDHDFANEFINMPEEHEKNYI